mmetsp:Transcript_7509/g.11012  ORF Transcript_7509/g.11012 Transcript_7509/m.11012 type:complete len:365 (-) Transcript_7509:224-1318(-)
MIQRFVSLILLVASANGFVSTPNAPIHKDDYRHDLHRGQSTLSMAALSSLPSGISPFESSREKASQNLGGKLRELSQKALKSAMKDGKTKLEIEFPPLLFKGKTQFDDFDNVQELDLNRDWCVEFLVMLKTSVSPPVWFLLPDTKECELCKAEWTGQSYRKAAQFSTIEAVTSHYSSSSDDGGGGEDYDKPWGATFASGMQKMMGGGGLLGDASSLDPLEGTASLHLVCQPGNGGPVEDWVNVEKLYLGAGGDVPTLVVNGALDKVRDGYYAGFFFPKLAATVDRFYKKFDSILYLKPLSDKGVYGWLYRVYPEDWQVVLQTVQTNAKGKQTVIDKVVYSSPQRPTYAVAIQKLLEGAREAASR